MLKNNASLFENFIAILDRFIPVLFKVMGTPV